jgi:hypothetical protein
VTPVTTLTQVLDGIIARLETIDGLRVVPYVPDNVPGYPAAVLFPPVNDDYSDAIYDGSATHTFVIMLFVPAAVDRTQLDLYALLDSTGSSSIFAAFETDRTLGGLNVDCRVVSANDPLARGQMASTQVYQRAVTVQAIVS